MKSSRRQPPSRLRKRNPPLGLVVAADVVLLAAGLMLFALFHHVLPRDTANTGQTLPGPTTTPYEASPSPAATAGTTAQTSASATGSATGPTQTAASTTGAGTTSAPGSWGEKFAEKFTSGKIEQTETSYRSANISLVITKHQADKVTYYVADIHLRDIQYFRTAFAGGSYARGRTDEVLDMAVANKAILAISGDYFGIRDQGIVIRNGVLYRETPYQDVLLMNNDGSMQTFARSEFNIAAVKAKGAWQAWSFGPMLLKDGQPMTSFNSSVTGLNPRSAIGYFEPGHYCFVLVDGRQPDYSVGMTMKQLSQLFFDLGCKVAYNLDGGQSAAMTFLDGLANQPYNGGRRISDIVYIAE
jgi:exopolysaccharide biosynthesis protein